jgi:hypothetical protein
MFGLKRNGRRIPRNEISVFLLSSGTENRPLVDAVNETASFGNGGRARHEMWGLAVTNAKLSYKKLVLCT